MTAKQDISAPRGFLRNGTVHYDRYREQWDEKPFGDIPLEHSRRHPAYCVDCQLTQYACHTKDRALFVEKHQEQGHRVFDPLVSFAEASGSADITPLEAAVVESPLGRVAAAAARWSLTRENYLDACINLGNALTDLKASLRHGEWTQTLSAIPELQGMTQRRLTDFMRLAEFDAAHPGELRDASRISEALDIMRQTSEYLNNRKLQPAYGLETRMPDPGEIPALLEGPPAKVSEPLATAKSEESSDLGDEDDEGTQDVDEWTDEDWDRYIATGERPGGKSEESSDLEVAATTTHRVIESAPVSGPQSNEPDLVASGGWEEERGRGPGLYGDRYRAALLFHCHYCGADADELCVLPRTGESIQGHRVRITEGAARMAPCRTCGVDIGWVCRNTDGSEKFDSHSIRLRDGLAEAIIAFLSLRNA